MEDPGDTNNVLSTTLIAKHEKLFFVSAIVIVIILLLISIYLFYIQKPAATTELNGKSANQAVYEGWAYAGDFPASAVDITTLHLTDGKYVAYYVGGSPGVYNYKKPGRAFSNDGVSWTVDSGWTCSDLCSQSSTTSSGPTLVHRKQIVLKDGEYRTYMYSTKANGIISFISKDGLTWSLEPGVRIARDTTDPLEQGRDTMTDFSTVYLPDGTMRAYFEGQPVQTSISSNCCDVVLSAISHDDGLTFTKEAGIRINSKDYGQYIPNGTNGNFDPTGSAGYESSDPSVVAMDGGYRVFYGTITTNESAFSKDGLNFTWDRNNMLDFPPQWGGDPSPILLNDGRLVLIAGGMQSQGSQACYSIPAGCPENYDLDHILIWEKLPVNIAANSWNNTKSQASVSIHSENGFNGSVSLSVLDADAMNCSKNPQEGAGGSPGCLFDRGAYQVIPSSGSTPLSAIVSRAKPAPVGKDNQPKPEEDIITLLAEANGIKSISAIRCINVISQYTPNCH